MGSLPLEPEGQRRRGGRVNPLSEHLDALEKATLDWLEASLFENSPSDTKRQLRKAGLNPLNPDAEMPEAYRLWRTCERHDTLWWSGGISNQPHVMMLEFSACEMASNTFDDQLANIKKILGRS